jgi:hypothetical protein
LVGAPCVVCDVVGGCGEDEPVGVVGSAAFMVG